jgi:hypothetical protein
MWRHTNLFPGDTIFKFMTIPVHSMRHKFLTYKQHKNWQKYQSRLKRRGGGLGFEHFYYIGLSQFCDENMKEEKNGMIILRKTLKNISSDYFNDYEDLNKYSFDYDFKDEKLK